MPTNYKEIIARATGIKEHRGAMYRTEPKDIVPIEVLEAVALLKAFRGYEGLSIGKKIDEYTDLMNYCAFIIERLEDKTPKKNQKINPRPVCLGHFNRSRQCRENCPANLECAMNYPWEKEKEETPYCYGRIDILKSCCTRCELRAECAKDEYPI